MDMTVSKKTTVKKKAPATRKTTARPAASRKAAAKPVMDHDPLSLVDGAAPPVDAAPEAPASERPPTVEDAATSSVASASLQNGELSLGPALTIVEVAAVRGQLQAALTGEGELRLSAGELEQLDGAGLQLLAAFCKEAAKQERAVKWTAASPVLMSAAELLGLDEGLGLHGGAAR